MLYFTHHAVQKMDGYGVGKEEVKQVIAQGIKWKEPHTEKWHAQMMGLEAVFTKEGDNYLVITVHRAGRE